MPSAPAPELESPAPAYLSLPDRAGSLGDIACDLVETAGVLLDEHQRTAVDALQSIKGDGSWAMLEACVVEPRQNGKTGGILLPIVLAHAIFVPNQLIVWSAHRYKTSHEAFLAMLRLLGTEEEPTEIGQLVSHRSYANGDEGFEFHNGSRIVFVARSQASGRGLSGDLVILDEALFLTDAMMGALFPTLSARPNPLLIYASSAGLASSTVLQSIRDRGRSGGDPSLAYVEWCAPDGGCVSKDCDHARDAEGCALEVPANWVRANPAVAAGRMTLEYIAAERRALSPAEFARERMGWWESAANGGLFHMPSWWKIHDTASTPGERVVLGLHTSPDRAWSTVAVASTRGDGVVHLEVIARRAGVTWLAPYVVERRQRHTVDGIVLAAGMASGSLIPELEDLEGFRGLTVSDVARACAALYDSTEDADAPRVAYRPVDEFDEAVQVAVQAARRSSPRGSWYFAADADVDLSPLYAIALALWGCRTEDDVSVSVWHLEQLGNCSDWDCLCTVVLGEHQDPMCVDCGHLHGDGNCRDEDCDCTAELPDDSSCERCDHTHGNPEESEV